MLPSEPFDGMVYIDNFGIQWIYSGSDECWMHNGKINKLPVATATTAGLLSKEFKILIDSIPPKGGGFGIITKPLNKLRSQSNPDGIIFGDVILRSNSLDIKCVNSEGEEITSNSCVIYKETDNQPPGFDLNFSDSFIKSFCVEVCSCPGPRGEVGDVGSAGEDGTGDGPQGAQGDPGNDAVEHYTFTGIKVIDTDEIYDTAVVKLELLSNDGQLVVTKGKVKLPDDDTAIEKLITTPLLRNIKFGDCFDYTITRPADDGWDLDPTVLFYPQHFSPDGPITEYQVVPKQLSDVIAQIIAFYNKQLDETNDKWNKEILDWVITKDKEAREAVDGLVGELFECENISNIEYCVGLNKECVWPT